MFLARLADLLVLLLKLCRINLIAFIKSSRRHLEPRNFTTINLSNGLGLVRLALIAQGTHVQRFQICRDEFPEWDTFYK